MNQIDDSVFEKIGEAIGKILKKYELDELQQQQIQEFILSSDAEEKKDIFNNLPGAKIANLVRGYMEDSFKKEDLPPLLEKELGLSSGTAEKMAEDLNKSVFPLIKEDQPSRKKPSRKDLYRESVQ